MYLDTKLNFEEHINNILNKISKDNGLLRKLQITLSCPFLVTVHINI